MTKQLSTREDLAAWAENTGTVVDDSPNELDNFVLHSGIQTNVYTKGQYQIDEAYGEYHMLYFPMGPARRGLPICYRMSSYRKLQTAIDSVFVRVSRDKIKPQDAPCMQDLEFQTMYARDMIPWKSWSERHPR